MTVVSDTSPINYLILTEYVGLLYKLYGRVVVPGKVFEELSSAKAPAAVRAWCAGPPDWLEVKALSKSDSSLKLTGGEREVILLAEEIKAMTYLAHITCLAPKGLRLKAQGCRFGYPGNWRKRVFNRKAVASVRQDFNASRRSQPRCGCKGAD